MLVFFLLDFAIFCLTLVDKTGV